MQLPRISRPLLACLPNTLICQDYALRAKDHKKKQTVLRSLKQKASERNEDEFYYAMLSRGKFSASKLSSGKNWTGTVAGDRGNKALDVETVRLLKTQDMGYLRTMRSVVAKEVTDLEEKVVIARAFAGIDANQEDEEEDDDDDSDSEEDEAPRNTKFKAKPKKIVFADSTEEVEKILPKQDDDDVDMHDSDDAESDHNKTGKVYDERRRERIERLQRRLQNAKKKMRSLAAAENALEMQRARMAKTQTVGGITKSGKKFKVRERKR